MPSSIEATVGAANANSFLSTAEMDTYADNQLNADAYNDETDSDTKVRAMLRAAREIDLMPWKGTRVNSTQALSWPRDEVANPDLPWASQEPQDSYYYPTDEIPQRVKNAQAELTIEFLKAGTTDLAARDPNLDVKREKTDVLETEYFEPHQRAESLMVKFPRIYNEIAPLLAASAGANTIVRM